MTEIDGFSTYVGAAKDGIDRILETPLLEALPSDLFHRFDGTGDSANHPPAVATKGSPIRDVTRMARQQPTIPIGRQRST